MCRPASMLQFLLVLLRSSPLCRAHFHENYSSRRIYDNFRRKCNQKSLRQVLAPTPTPTQAHTQAHAYIRGYIGTMIHKLAGDMHLVKPDCRPLSPGLAPIRRRVCWLLSSLLALIRRTYFREDYYLYNIPMSGDLYCL